MMFMISISKKIHNLMKLLAKAAYELHQVGQCIIPF
jgi:hypothetical protein